MAIDYSAMSDVVNKVGGIPLEPKGYYKELETGCFRAVPDNGVFIDELIKFFKQPKAVRMRMGYDTYKRYNEYFSWDKAADKWMSLFDEEEMVGNWAVPAIINNPVSFEQIPTNLNNQQYVNFLIENVLGEPNKVNSYMATRLLRDLNNGISFQSGHNLFYNEESFAFTRNEINLFGREKAHYLLFQMAQRRNHWERMRIGELNK